MISIKTFVGDPPPHIKAWIMRKPAFIVDPVEDDVEVIVDLDGNEILKSYGNVTVDTVVTNLVDVKNSKEK